MSRQQRLEQVARELEAAGAWPGHDFLVEGVTSAATTGDYLQLRLDGPAAVVDYHDRGTVTELLRTDDLESAVGRFHDEVLAHRDAT